MWIRCMVSVYNNGYQRTNGRSWFLEGLLIGQIEVCVDQLFTIATFMVDYYIADIDTTGIVSEISH